MSNQKSLGNRKLFSLREQNSLYAEVVKVRPMFDDYPGSTENVQGYFELYLDILHQSTKEVTVYAYESVKDFVSKLPEEIKQAFRDELSK